MIDGKQDWPSYRLYTSYVFRNWNSISNIKKRKKKKNKIKTGGLK